MYLLSYFLFFLHYVLTYLALLSFYLSTLYYSLIYLIQEWLRGYRLGGGVKDGGAAVYLLSRQQLQKWWYVDKMTPHAAAGKVPRGVRGVCSQGAPGEVGAGSHARMLCRYVQNVFKTFL